MIGAGIRIDKLLYFLRFAKSRTLAQFWAEAGHIRVNGRRVEKASAPVQVGDVVTLPKGDMVLAIQIDILPLRRGPPNEAKACYQLLN
ncbi:MAG: S4 domain-containing protein [Sphingorhabdus sp.]